MGRRNPYRAHVSPEPSRPRCAHETMQDLAGGAVPIRPDPGKEQGYVRMLAGACPECGEWVEWWTPLAPAEPSTQPDSPRVPPPKPSSW